MESIKIEFKETNNALAELSEALMVLNKSLSLKKEELKNNKKNEQKKLEQSEQNLESLKGASAHILHNIDSIINRLDKVLEEDGTSNSNN